MNITLTPERRAAYKAAADRVSLRERNLAPWMHPVLDAAAAVQLAGGDPVRILREFFDLASLTDGHPIPQNTTAIRAAIATLEGRLATLAGEGLRIADRQGARNDVPPGGALLHVQMAVADQSHTKWYPTAEAAKAALLVLARSHGTVPSEDGWQAVGWSLGQAGVEKRSK